MWLGIVQCMGRRKCLVDTTWRKDLAYIIGMIATDGNLSSDGRHICITSKDEDLLHSIKSTLGLSIKIGKKARGYTHEKKYHTLQIGDVAFYEFLLSIGLTPAKSKTISTLAIPESYYADFFRGCIDGDGNIGTFAHPESQRPQVRIRLCSASRPFLEWILSVIQKTAGVTGGFICKGKSVHILSFASADSRKLLKFMYYDDTSIALARKRLIAQRILGE